MWYRVLGGVGLGLLSACSGGGGNTAATAIEVPGSVQALAASAGNARVSLSFGAPASDGGAAITGYSASCSGGPGVVSANGPGSPLLVTGLVNGTAYVCSVTAHNSKGAGPASSVNVTPHEGPVSAGFRGSVVLGSPTRDGIRLNLLSSEQSGQFWLAWGTTPAHYPQQTAVQTLNANLPAGIELKGLLANTQYFYRIHFRENGADVASVSPEYRFHTARPSGSTFSFTVQADPHLDENSNLDVYRLTLDNLLADAPDFHMDLGDTFMTEKHSEPLSAVLQRAPDATTVNARYAYEHHNFGRMTHSVPLFLVNGNHEGEVGWLNNGSAQNNAIWAAQARKTYFVNPEPSDFYSGDAVADPFVGLRAAWYAYQWGDALFIALDPFWNSVRGAANDPWNITLGERQYRWLEQTLAASTAKYKFVFLHNLTGGLDGQMRGGIEAAPYFEWGGRNLDGTNVFSSKRSGWGKPIHELLVEHHVTAVFHGHDHVYVKQDLNGIVYQAVPQPSAANFQNGESLAAEYHYNSGVIKSSPGYLRVTVTPEQVTSEYVRTWLPSNENASRHNKQVDDTWSVTSRRQ